MVFLLTAVSLSAYMANEGMMCQYLSDMTSNLKFKKKKFQITTYPLMVWPKFKLPICDLKFDILPT